MRALAVLPAVALALSACTTTSDIDTAIRNNLPKTCNLIETAYAAFSTVASTGNIKAATVAKVDRAYDATRMVCADPANVTVANALIIAANAYVIIAGGLREARTVEVSQ